ncbi:ABC transporter ATP-binding protein [Halorarum salinum]|uniref:Molybdate/tungstate import ATP-binding protein WtpC n=1 Tax=Halorarum salinum TaxID=2743089 RepID=A0A7D5QET3_9EURY|nr:ABC transporter ATP-binding protein [Halobaculum salinum]
MAEEGSRAGGRPDGDGRPGRGTRAAADVRLEDLRVEYGSTTALDGVDLHVEPGEFFTLVGPSGCGKTTTLRAVAGFESPTGGSVAIGGEPMRGVPPEARGVGVVFQNYALFPHMTVAENVGYGLRFADPPGGASREERVAELLDLVDLPGFGERDPSTLSGGQRQRVSLARALAPGPRLLLLDEPMSALDARLRERLRVQVREIQRELAITTVYVTHDQEEALAVSDRVAVMNDGGVEQVGAPRDVYRQPATRFVAEFLGDNNVFSGEVLAVDDGRATVDVAGRDLVVADGSLSVGDRAVVSVRPERLRAVDAGSDRATADVLDATDAAAAADAGNRLAVTVRSAEFLGDATRLHCDWDGTRLTALTDRNLSGAVTLGFDPADAYVVGVE